MNFKPSRQLSFSRVLTTASVALLALAGSAVQAETDREYCERQQGAVRDVCLRGLAKAPPASTPAAPAAAATSASESERAYCERQQGAVRDICLRELAKKPKSAPAAAATAAPAAEPKAMAPAATATAAASGKLYTVRDGDHVDAATYEGFKTWRAAACDRCHGAEQQGMVGPSLIASLKVLSKAEFDKVLVEGRLSKGMPSFSTSAVVVEHLDELYAYLKGRSDGAITHAKVSLISSK